jgi:DNA invertase Pin-like site-specific DNA recombinase
MNLLCSVSLLLIPLPSVTRCTVLPFSLSGAKAERKRTQAGLMAARARGRRGGRPKALSSKQLDIARDLYEKHHPIAEICRTLKISKATLYRYIKTGGRDQ